MPNSELTTIATTTIVTTISASISASIIVSVAIARDSSVEVMEVVRRLVVGSVVRVRAVVAMTGVEVLIDVPAEVVAAVKPRAGSDKDAIAEPLRTVVAVGSAVVRREIIVAIRADRGRPNVHAQRHLGRAGFCGAKEQGSRSKKGKGEVPFTHTQSPRLNWSEMGGEQLFGKRCSGVRFWRGLGRKVACERRRGWAGYQSFPKRQVADFRGVCRLRIKNHKETNLATPNSGH